MLLRLSFSFAASVFCLFFSFLFFKRNEIRLLVAWLPGGSLLACDARRVALLWLVAPLAHWVVLVGGAGEPVATL